MTSDKSGIEEVDAMSPPAKRGFGAKLKAHFKRFWWLHVIIFIIVVLVIALPVVYVGYPNIAQGDVNDSTLNITKQVISSPAPHSFHLKQRQVIRSGSVFKPDLFAFNASVGLASAAAPFANVLVPKIHVEHKNVITLDQHVELSSVEAFTEYTKAVLLSEEVSLIVAGKPDLKLGALPRITVNYNETVTMKALNKLKGFNVPHFNIQVGQTGVNMNGTVYIPNPTVMTIAMGNVTLDLSVDGTHIGQSFLNDLVLKPGNNTLPMKAAVSQGKVLDMILGSGAKHSNGLLPVDITGNPHNSSVYDGQPLPYYSKALASNTLQVTLNVGAALKRGNGIDINATANAV